MVRIIGIILFVVAIILGAAHLWKKYTSPDRVTSYDKKSMDKLRSFLNSSDLEIEIVPTSGGIDRGLSPGYILSENIKPVRDFILEHTPEEIGVTMPVFVGDIKNGELILKANGKELPLFLFYDEISVDPRDWYCYRMKTKGLINLLITSTEKAKREEAPHLYRLLPDKKEGKDS